MAAPPPPAPPSPGGPAIVYPPGTAPPEAPVRPQPRAPPEPGSFDNLHQEVKGIFCMPHLVFEGGKFTFVRGVGEHMQVSHALHLGPNKSSYHFSPTYIGPKKVSPSEAFPVVLGDIDTEGSMIAQIIHEFAPGVTTKFQAQTQGRKWLGAQLEANYHGANSCTGIKLVNVNPATESGIWIVNYMQKLTKRLAAGGELLYQYQPQVVSTVFTAGARYRGDDYVASGSLSPAGLLQASYFHSFNPKIAAGCELEINLTRQEAVAHLGFQHNFQQSVCRGQISTNGVVAGYLEHTLMPAITLSLSASLDHFSNTSRFGIGFTVGQ